MKARLALRFLTAYARARWHDGIADRARLETIQRRWLRSLQNYVVRHSAFYAPYAQIPWAQWPMVDKTAWMNGFDEINTVGARLAKISSIALQAEHTRDFSRHWHGHSVGMSTGTSGNRGIFLVSPTEGAQWAGTLIGKLLRSGLLARERVALVLRAGATLYEAIGALRLRFRFFDQAEPWHELAADVRAFRPTILIAPASALRLLADAPGGLQPRRVISVAEVLDALDRQHIERGFGVAVEQIYQATEGLLGMSCEHGTVHLNEPYVFIEQEWLDPERTRFVPIVTDLWRHTQPVVRYRLNDVLRVADAPCPCGRASLALSAIEGRSDDVLWLDGERARVPVFPDLLARTVLSVLPQLEDFRIVEQRRGAWSIGLRPLPPPAAREQLRERITALTTGLAAPTPELSITELPELAHSGKQRRVLGVNSHSCVS